MPKRRLPLRVICDLDGVVANFDDSARALLKEHRGVDAPPSDGWDSIQSYCTDEDWGWLWAEGVELGLFRNCVPYAGAEPALRQLDRLVELAFVTSRPKAAIPDTLAWLGRYRFPVPELHVVCDRPKSDVVPQADIYIDDGPHVIDDLRRNTHGLVLIFDRPWNRDAAEDEYRGVYRLKRWTDVVAFVRQEAEKRDR